MMLPYLVNRTTSLCKVLTIFVSHFCSNILTGKAAGALLVKAGLVSYWWPNTRCMNQSHCELTWIKD